METRNKEKDLEKGSTTPENTSKAMAGSLHPQPKSLRPASRMIGLIQGCVHSQSKALRSDAFQGLTGLWVMIGPNGEWTVLGKKILSTHKDPTQKSPNRPHDVVCPDRFQELRLRPRLGRMVRTEVDRGKAKEP
ncbi:hypothetical protein F2Q69_00040321 [Brassica cretica]|uniref:Uncharacterized protein n=1 Tax=Brassica cretica TaxID=69181 RepID=A0A8S9N5S2_BRACR|nr:hypothetical protein F2Q69_00040321 [Brassica cretica]